MQNDALFIVEHNFTTDLVYLLQRKGKEDVIARQGVAFGQISGNVHAAGEQRQRITFAIAT
jgi:hypothetical protein